jgi:hypothetical protein
MHVTPRSFVPAPTSATKTDSTLSSERLDGRLESPLDNLAGANVTDLRGFMLARKRCCTGIPKDAVVAGTVRAKSSTIPARREPPEVSGFSANHCFGRGSPRRVAPGTPEQAWSKSRDEEREEHQMDQHASGLVDDLGRGGYHDGRNQRDRRGSPAGGGSDVGAIHWSQA